MCEINKPAAQKRWSRLMRRLECYVPPVVPADDGSGGAKKYTAIDTNGEEVDVPSPAKTPTPNKKQKKAPATTPASKATTGSKRKRTQKDVGVKDEVDADASAGEESPVKTEGGIFAGVNNSDGE